MKKLLFILLVMFLFSCEKDDPRCWTCNIHPDRTGSSYSYNEQVCNRTSSEIKDYESHFGRNVAVNCR